MPDRFHLGWFLDGYRVPAWNKPWSGTSSRDWLSGQFYVDMARDLERGCFDYFMLEDSNYVPSEFGGSMDAYLKYGQRAPKLDPTALASIIARDTRRIGVIATVATTEISPFRLARLMVTLDHISDGRIGWNIVTGSNDAAARNFGFDRQPEHDARYDLADEFIRAAKALWDSWDDDAVVMDTESGFYVDPSKVHRVDFSGAHFSTRGPLNTIPGPQKQPVLLQAGVSPRGMRFSAQHADSIIATGSDVAAMKAVRDGIRAYAVEAGRDPDEIKVMFITEPVLGETVEEATAKVSRIRDDAMRTYDHNLGGLSSVTMIDFAQFDPDQPLPAGLTTNGHQGQLNDMIASGKTLRELAAAPLANGMRFVGTPASVAADMEDVMREVGGDGFLFSSLTPTRRYVSEIVDGVVPELQKRGLVRTSYSEPTLRGNLRAF
ncbi:NtaA/DmoA family FMN-dependent monooxygenase [Frondihabitans australicus]|uniref:FMN-dependent oxidoreductase (Nitrilotriacetate monooxygenase family) n=1 Tax=Frondihabitans australicus TaxID=386892 RepID=A0A495IC32_9MICO|nr:NtaA/DmoA family FMN-dependent monooxygenase [Frondihabitans australicus]RKR73564.1 FMN-dependent oxidoreductase (nitrilotriacetate monooxygenase family) [Frondihabitans australicus]